LKPELSVVLISPDSYETIRRTIGYLRQQTARHLLELVIVTPSREKLHPDEQEMAEFRHSRIVEVGGIGAIGSAYAEGLRHASGSVVALAEDHSYPDPGWAAALIEAHRKPWAAVGPAIRNANPENTVSWADLYIAYSRWLHPAEGGPAEHLPGHNSSYKRDILLSYGADLDSMMEAESVLHWNLRAKGFQLCLEPSAIIAHTNFSLLTSWVPVQFHCGRQFAASRAQNERWSWLRRIFYACASPLIPLVRLRYILRDLQPPARRLMPLWSVLPALLLGLALDGLGQGLGYVLGPGCATEKLSELEFHRDRHRTQANVEGA
jgi:glycosyltransferase involved in cell wall biosynthesis